MNAEAPSKMPKAKSSIENYDSLLPFTAYRENFASKLLAEGIPKCLLSRLAVTQPRNKTTRSQRRNFFLFFYESLLTYTQQRTAARHSGLSRRVIVKLRRDDNLKIIALNEMMNTHNFPPTLSV